MKAGRSKEWQRVKFGEIAREVRSTTKTPIEDGLEFYIGLENETKEEMVPDDKQALTQIFIELKNSATPQMVANIVEDIDKIVRATRFDGWQNSITGERDIQKVLRQTLFKYKLHTEQELFEKAYGYIREHY